MIEFPYKIRLYTQQNLFEESNLKLLINEKFISKYKPSNYGDTEDLKFNFNANNVSEIASFFYNSYNFYLNFDQKSLIWFDEINKKVKSVLYFLSQKTKIKDLKSILIEIVNEINFILLSGYSEEEYKIKHHKVTYKDSNVVGIGAVGTSRTEFSKYLPGIYSFTVFGPEIIEFFSQEKLEGMKTVFPNLEYFKDTNYFGFQIDDENQPLEIVILIQKEIAKYLGQEYFFDRDLIGIVDFKPIPTILEKIK